MEKTAILEKLMDLLGQVTTTMNILIVAQRLTESVTDSEREALAHALSTMMGTDQAGRHAMISSQENPMGFYNQR